MKHKALPYIGITGFAAPYDVPAVARARSLLPPGYLCMAGVLVSGKTLHNRELPNIRYPRPSLLSLIFQKLSAAGAWAVAHYNPGGQKEPLSEQLSLLMEKVPWARGIQMNWVNPDPKEVDRFRQLHPDIPLILQVNKSSLVSRDPEEVRRYVRSYEGRCAYALVDMSGGRGAPIDEEWAASVLKGWTPEDPLPGVAGGLGKGSGGLISRLQQSCPVPLSCDAEGKIRIPVNAKSGHGDDTLEIELAEAYLTEACAALGPTPATLPL